MRRDRVHARLDEGEIRLVVVAKRGGHRNDEEIRGLGLKGGAQTTIVHLFPDKLGHSRFTYRALAKVYAVHTFPINVDPDNVVARASG